MKYRVIVVIAVLTGVAAAEEWPFQKYPAPVIHVKPAPLKLSIPIAKQHISAMQAAVRLGPNFAGHFTIATWGCGTSCGVYVVVNNATGNVYAPPEIARGVSLGLGGPEFRPNSRLMVVANCPDPGVYGLKNCHRKFYEWGGSRLILLKAQPVTTAEQDH